MMINYVPWLYSAVNQDIDHQLLNEKNLNGILLKISDSEIRSAQ